MTWTQRLCAGIHKLWERCAAWRARSFAKDPARTQQDAFLREWTRVFTQEAEAFNGLYTGLVRVQQGRSKKGAQHLGEWAARAHYKWPGQAIDEVTAQCFASLAREGAAEEQRQWAGLLLQAAAAAGIRQDHMGQRVLDEDSVLAYRDWDGEELYLGDPVEVTVPAWRQNGRIVEQGYCKKRVQESE